VRQDLLLRDDPAQRMVLTAELDRILGDSERSRARPAADREVLAELREQARRQGVPPGWLR
jgi:hypothetical protein